MWADLFFQRTSDGARGNYFKLCKRRFRLVMKNDFFPLRVVKPWTRLPRPLVESPSL